MSGTWYPSARDQLEAEQRSVQPRAPTASPDGASDWEDALYELAADGNVEALEALREQLPPIDYDELGWAD